MSDTTDLAIRTEPQQAQMAAPPPAALVSFSREQIEVLRQTVAKDATDAELGFFLQLCRHLGADPFAKQVYAIKRDGKMTFQMGIDWFRLAAQRTHEYRGQAGPWWTDGSECSRCEGEGMVSDALCPKCLGDGLHWTLTWIGAERPKAAKACVYREGFIEPVWGRARYESFVQTVREGGANRQWRLMPEHMLGKCAEALALRKAFPAELSGVYTPEEMAQADRPDPGRRQPPHPRPSVEQIKQIGSELQALNYDADGARRFMSDVAGRPIQQRAELTLAEASLVLRAIADLRRPPVVDAEAVAVDGDPSLGGL